MLLSLSMIRHKPGLRLERPLLESSGPTLSEVESHDSTEVWLKDCERLCYRLCIKVLFLSNTHIDTIK